MGEAAEPGFEIVVRAKHGRLPRGLRARAEEKILHAVRLVLDVRRVEVDYSEEPNRRVADHAVCDVIVHLSRRVVRAHASAATPDAALDLVVDKVQHQLARIKERRVGRTHPRRSHADAAPAPSDAAGADVETDVDDGDIGVPRIVRRRFSTKPMDPVEAALALDGRAFLLFTNRESGRAALVYRRDDGDVGLIETT